MKRRSRPPIYLLVAALTVPAGAAAAAAPPESGIFGGPRVGVMFVDELNLSVRGEADLGLRLHLGGPLSVEASALAGIFRTPVRRLNSPSSSSIGLPFLGRLAIVVDVGFASLYAGGSAGTSIQFGDAAGNGSSGTLKQVQFMWNVAGGAIFSIRPGEMTVEVGGAPLALSGTDVAANLGVFMMLGWRFTTWGADATPGERRGRELGREDLGG